MSISLSQTFITVDDHDGALTFYRDAVGLEVRNDVGFGEFRWVSVGAPEQPDVTIVLESPLADPNAAEADRRTVRDLMARGLLRGAIFGTDDCDAVFDQVRAGGGEVLQEPVDRPYGVRECAFRDPAGNMVQFHQPLAG
ncbi:VOC family protein [Spiractinospora alimapuensis]|uniref:VOC family protein n=1 Tax=Spiractinospora alimapuensis TaxID=2820884 RepID=UPI001F29059A|nr:VOC family protein [Spiractinospora alimapuensis]QVQ52921.1 VOC family protein [Spiractinospora alimapuensis]